MGPGAVSGEALAAAAIDDNAAMKLRADSSHRQSTAATRYSSTQRRVARWDRRHAVALAQAKSLDVPGLLRAADQVYVPGGQVALGNNGDQLVVYLPLQQFPDLAVGAWTPTRDVQAGIARPAPAGRKVTGTAPPVQAGRYASKQVRQGQN